ncbi:PucR family transcriptional regulator [uncultured Microbacterium sp.]|uniref:PucR family transcriptional regulator n=1 Tax=uncultured Microbacterium sp. TaxID=191216 RepID=UPI0035CBE391
MRYRLPRPQLPTVAEVLELDTLVRGDPIVVAGAAGLARHVRWVHVSEIATIAGLLRGGEMILTTGIALSNNTAELARYVDGLADAEISAIIVGLGPRFQHPLPAAMLAAADRHSLPLIALRRTTAFVDVTEEVHSLLVDVQVQELQASESIHVIFSDLAVQGSKPQAALHQVARLSGCAVVLEDLTHQVLAFDTGTRDKQDVLAEWNEHTRRDHGARPTDYDPRTGWLVTTVGARGEDWGRLILMVSGNANRVVRAESDPLMSLPRSTIMLLERAASTLALGRLLDRDREVLELHTHRSLLTGMLSSDQLTRDIALESAAIGVPLDGQSNLALAVRRARTSSTDPLERQGDLRALSEELAEFLRAKGCPALVGPVDGETVGAVVTLNRTIEIDEFLDHVAVAVGSGNNGGPITGVAGPTVGAVGARQALVEALEVARAASTIGTAQGYVRSKDLGLDGLLVSLIDDPRVQRFSESFIGPLLLHDEERGSNLVALLRQYLNAGRNKTVAARIAFVSRPWMYERLALISSVLDLDLDDERNCVTLQVALMAYDLAGKRIR